MKHSVWFIGIILLSQIAGCASLPASTGNANDQIDYWLSRQEYGKAAAILASLKESPSPATSNLEEVQEKIKSHIASYEQQVIAEADQAVATSDWGAAFALYRVALSRLPDSRPLHQGQQQLRQRHAAHVDQLELDRAIAKGEWTRKDLEISKVAEANNSGGWFGRYVLNRKIASADERGRELAEHGKRALERQDLTLAKRILPLAMALSSSVESKALNAQLQETLKERESRILAEEQRIAEAQLAVQRIRSEQQNDKERATFNSHEQRKAKRLMAEFRDASHGRHFVEAQRLMSQLETLGVESQEFQKLSKQLASDIARHVKHLIETGATHYSQQRYEAAMNVWKQAQDLDPKNEQLTARVKRVTRVLERLQNLRNKSSPAQ
jgi:tetratricopeptide (TPR) repeat protein